MSTRSGAITREPAVLGIDLGTSQVKALLSTRSGEVLGQGIAGYSVRAPRTGWAEIAPEEWWRAATTAVNAAVDQAGCDSRGREIVGLAIVGQMHGAVLTDASGAALRPAILWLDRRSSAEVEDYLRLPEPLRSALANPPSPGMAGPTLLWLSRHEPETYRRARWLLQPKDWLRLRLTGEAATDHTDASGTLLYDLGRHRWATEVVGALGLRGDLLPPLRPPAAIAGHLQPEAAAGLGLPVGLPVATGAADTAASVLAAALPGPGWCLLTLGTGGQWVVPVPEADSAADSAAGRLDPSGQTNLFAAADGGAYRLAAAQNVGIALDWVSSILRTSWADLYGTADAPWQPGTPLFLPYLAGERWDHATTGPTGAWEGLSLAHQREDLLRAALEGVAFLLRTKLDDLHRVGCRPEKIVLAGGGSQHPSWRRLLADVFRLPLFTASTPWLSARGGTLIAGVATGLYSSWADAAKSIPPPEPAAAAGHTDLAEEHYQRFRSLRDRAGRPAVASGGDAS
jgi:xylulokinase